MPIEFQPPSTQPFQITPPQYTDPLQTLAQMGQLRTQGLQQQSAQLGLEGERLKQQQAQEDFADQQKMRDVYKNWLQSGNTKTDDLVRQAGSAGVGPRTLMPLQQQLLEHRTKLATATELEFKNTVSKQAQQTQALNAVASAPPDQRPVAWQTQRQNLITAGYATPDEIPPDYPGDVAFEELRHHNRTSEQELALVKEKREADAAAATTQKTQLEVTAGTKQQLISDARSAEQDPKTGTPTPPAWQAILNNTRYKGLNLPQIPTKAYLDNLAESTIPEKDLPEYRIKTGQADAMRAWRSGDPTKIDQVVDNIAPQSDPMNATTKNLLHYIVNSGGTKEEFDKAVKDLYDHRKTIATETDPTVQAAKEQVARVNAQTRQNITIQGLGSVDQPSTAAQMVADYKVPLQTALSRTPPQARNAFLAQVNALNPQFQERYYDAAQKTEIDATTGDLAKKSTALSTMMGHLGTLDQAADGLANNDSPLLKRIANTWGVATGGTAKTIYDAIVHRLGPEVTKAYVASGGSVGERGTNEDDFNANLGASQIKQNIGISASLADSLIRANQDQYSRGTYGRGQQKLMSDDAEAIRQRLIQRLPANLRGHGAAGLPVAAPKKDDTKLYQGHTYKFDGTKWVRQ